MMLFFCCIPVFLFFGLLGLFVFCRMTDEMETKEAGIPCQEHPDKNLPLYNRGHCDRYSVGTFSW